MRKRRVGVTARSRQIVGNQVTGTPQFATEIAAPLELRTPMGTCGEGRNQSADGSMVTMARELTGRMQSEKSRGGKQSMPGRVARCARPSPACSVSLPYSSRIAFGPLTPAPLSPCFHPHSDCGLRRRCPLVFLIQGVLLSL